MRKERIQIDKVSIALAIIALALIICTGIAVDKISITIMRSSINIRSFFISSLPSFCRKGYIGTIFIIVDSIFVVTIFLTKKMKDTVLYLIIVLSLISSASMILLLKEVAIDKGIRFWSTEFKLILIERSLWLSLALLIPFIGPIVSLWYLARGFLQVERKEERNDRYQKLDKNPIILIGAVFLSLLTFLLPHLPSLNPHLVTISVDTRYNVMWLKVLEKKGLYHGLQTLSKALRPLYLIFIYLFYKAIEVSPTTFADIFLQVVGFLILIIVVYTFFNDWSSLLVPLYLGPIFLYGGFQTNLYALSMLYTLFYFIQKERHTMISLILFIILGLWHPWTLAYFSVVFIAMVLLKGVRNFSREILFLTISWVITLVVDATLGGFSASPGIIKPGVTPGPKPYFTLFIYVWGTMARPEILLPAAFAIMLKDDIDIYSIAISLSFLSIILLNYCGAFRVLLEAPIPIILGSRLKSWRSYLKTLVLIPAITSWFYLIISSIPP